MRILYLTAGSGRMECDACLRDGDLARAFLDAGQEVLLTPTYTPLVTEEARQLAGAPLFFGGINVYLRHRFPRYASLPATLQKILDAPWLLKWAARMGDMTAPEALAELTLSMLEGEDGPHRRELERMVDWMAPRFQPHLIVLPNTLFAGMAHMLKERFQVPLCCLLSGEDAFVEAFPEPFRKQNQEKIREKCRDVDAFVAPNITYKDFMQDYLDLPEKKLYLIRSSLDLNRYHNKPRPLPEVFTLGFRAEIIPANGLHLVADAFAKMKKRPEMAKSRLRIAGYAGKAGMVYLKKVLKKLEAEGVGPDVEVLGELEPIERARFMEELSLLSVVPLYPEPTGLYVAEALAAGCPVAVPDSGCLKEWVEQTGGGVTVQQATPAILEKAFY